MKLFSILNKPAVKAGNKQAGIVFLEYVIMAFIATVAIICALWWFYWHLQQMTWEIKGKLDVLKTLNCELEPPYGVAPEEQPHAIKHVYNKGPFTIPEDGWDYKYYNWSQSLHVTLIVHNTSEDHDLYGSLDFIDWDTYTWEKEDWFTIGPGESYSSSYTFSDLDGKVVGFWIESSTPGETWSGDIIAYY